MKIIAKSTGLSKQELYNLMSPTQFTNMRDKVETSLEIKNFVVHEESTEHGNKKVLSLETNKGEIVVSASRSLVSEFEKIVTIFGVKAVKEIEILEGQSGSGFAVLSCRLPSMAV